MSILYGSLNVDERYAPIVEPNLFTDTVLIPNVTYTDKYEIGPAGQIFVHKLTKPTVKVGTPGRDFEDVAAADTLIPIALNNNFQSSEKIYGVQAAAVAFDAGEEFLSLGVNSAKETRQYAALACLAYEGTYYNSYEAATKDNVVANLLALRKAVKDAHGKANFALVSTKVYALLLEKLGFQQAPDPAVVSGELMKRFGLTIIECNSLDEDGVEYYDATGTKRTIVLDNVEMIVGNFEAFSVVDNLEVLRIVDSEMFAGSKAQVEINTGFKVTTAAQIQVGATSALISA